MFISLDLFQSFVQKTRLVFVLLQMYSMVQFIVIRCRRCKDLRGGCTLICLLCCRQLPANARLLQIKRIEFRVDITQQVGLYQHLSNDSKQSHKSQWRANCKTLQHNKVNVIAIKYASPWQPTPFVYQYFRGLKMKVHKVLRLLEQLSGPDIAEEFAEQQLV